MPRQQPVAAGYGNLPNGYFIPEIWSKKLNYKFYAQTCMDNIVNHRWEGEIKGAGATVNIRKRPTVVVSDYEVGGTINYQDLTDELTQLLIDKNKYWAIQDDDIDAHQADIDFINEATQDAAMQTKIKIEQDLFGTIYAQTTAANVMTSTLVSKTTVLDWIVDAKVLLSESNVPPEDRWLILPPWIIGMIEKSDLQNASLTGDKVSILRKGSVGRIADFEIFENNNLTDDGTTWQCIAGHPSFCSFAMQFVKTRLGIVLENTFAEGHRGLSVYGYKVTTPSAGVSMPAKKS